MTTPDKVQITNIGGQTPPVIQGILEFPCSLNILLHSNESAPTAQKIADLMGNTCQLHLINDANDFEGIVSFIDQIVSKCDDAVYFANVAGGTRIMTLALYTLFVTKSHIRYSYLLGRCPISGYYTIYWGVAPISDILGFQPDKIDQTQVTGFQPDC